jgi:hypothetical protein
MKVLEKVLESVLESKVGVASATDRRITVEQGIENYVATGAVPRQGAWRQCPLGVFALRFMQEGDPDLIGDIEAPQFCREVFGHEYVRGFISGFDFSGYRQPSEELSVRYREGYEDGAALLRAVRPWMEARTPITVFSWRTMQSDDAIEI